MRVRKRKEREMLSYGERVRGPRSDRRSRAPLIGSLRDRRSLTRAGRRGGGKETRKQGAHGASAMGWWTEEQRAGDDQSDGSSSLLTHSHASRSQRFGAVRLGAKQPDIAIALFPSNEI